MNTPAVRPEDRRRPAAEWPDTVPACFRSEGFAEDLWFDDEPKRAQEQTSEEH